MVIHDPASPVGPRRRAMLDGWGVPGPIEERAGRRLLRLVDPGSEEWDQLLRDGAVELIGPEGDSLGSIPLDEACAKLRRRLDGCPDARGRDRLTRPRSSAPS